MEGWSSSRQVLLLEARSLCFAFLITVPCSIQKRQDCWDQRCEIRFRRGMNTDGKDKHLR